MAPLHVATLRELTMEVYTYKRTINQELIPIIHMYIITIHSIHTVT